MNAKSILLPTMKVTLFLCMIQFIYKFLGKGAYLLEGPEGEILPNPRKAFYLKKFYPYHFPLKCVYLFLYSCI